MLRFLLCVDDEPVPEDWDEFRATVTVLIRKEQAVKLLRQLLDGALEIDDAYKTTEQIEFSLSGSACMSGRLPRDIVYVAGTTGEVQPDLDLVVISQHDPRPDADKPDAAT
jgi:hypothetical protein